MIIQLPILNNHSAFFKQKHLLWKSSRKMTEAKEKVIPDKSTVINDMIEKTSETDFKKVKSMAENFKGKDEPVILYFTGSLDADGKNWCSDCTRAEPVVEEFLKNAQFKKKIHLIHVPLTKEELKAKNNHYANDKDIKLKEVPTLLMFKAPKQLSAAECAQPDMLKIFFEDLVTEARKQ